ncbi:hypothetical protein R5W24_003288 [Gemmata sp. JC717]|uniref:hypothetical protein n=1 Tax=Gemmata algarum TaxID=2975278 RepID=UPI0021BAC5E4|nr:hypothetical protein [Gemmata algarum]MDY3554169.1 hypothetical protein [Gemmata algarum]
MPTSPGLSRKYPQHYPAPRKYALVIGCVDCRLLDDLVRFLDHDNLTNRYYQATFAGCTIALSSKAPVYYPRCDKGGNPIGEPMDFSAWQSAALDHLKLVLKLTKGDLTDVYIVEHADCGAYREFIKFDSQADPRREREKHAEYARAYAEELVAWYDSPEGKALADELREKFGAEVRPPLVRGFLMDLRGGVEPLFDLPTSRKKAKNTRPAADDEHYM